MGCDLENHGNGFDLPEPEVDVAALKKRMLDRITKVHSDEAEIERLRAENETLRDHLESIVKSHADGFTLNVEAATDYLSWLKEE